MAAAPRDPPAALLGAYTLQHQVPLERFYVDDASSMAGTTTRFSRPIFDTDFYLPLALPKGM